MQMKVAKDLQKKKHKSKKDQLTLKYLFALPDSLRLHVIKEYLL